MPLPAIVPKPRRVNSISSIHGPIVVNQSLGETSLSLPKSLTPISEEVYSDCDLLLNADSTSIAEADTEAVPERSLETETSLDLRRKRSAQSLDKDKKLSQEKSFFYLDFEELGEILSPRMKTLPSELDPSEKALMQANVHGYQTGVVAPRVSESLRPPNKRARPSINEPLSVNRSVYIDDIQEQTLPLMLRPGQPRTSATGLNIAPRAHRRAKRRAISKGPWAAALKHILPALKTETVISLLLSACERHSPTAENVRSYVVQDPSCRRLAVRNVPYSLSASELLEALENAFGTVDLLAVCTKGYGVVVFEHFESAFHAAFGHAVPDANSGHIAIPGEGTSSLCVRGRQLQFRFLHPSDTIWEILHGGQGIDVLSREKREAQLPCAKADGNSSSAAQVGPPRRHRPPGHASRRRRKTELLVRDLSPSITEGALGSAFAHFGDIRRVYIPTDAKGCSKRHGYLTFHRQEDAMRAAQQTQRLIGDQLAFVSLAGVDPNRSRRASHKQSLGGMALPQRRRGRNRTAIATAQIRGTKIDNEKTLSPGAQEDAPMADDSNAQQHALEA